jgi:hypothetical protein
MKKPSKTAVGGDSEASRCFIGFPAVLESFVFNVKDMLLQGDDGSLGNRGNAAVYALLALKQ